MALGPGSIAFVGFNADGNDDFAIVALVEIVAGTVITFRDDEWNGAAFADANEGTMTWTLTSAVAAGTVVSFTNQSSGRAVSTGTLAGENLAFSATTETLYAYLDGATPTFLAAIANDSFSVANGALDNTGLAIGSTAVQFTGSIDGMEFTGVRSGLASFADYLPVINNSANWATQASDGALLLPLDPTGFMVSAAGPVLLSIAPVVASQPEGSDGGSTSFDFTVTLGAPAVTDTLVSLSLAGDASDFNVVPASVTVLAGNSSAVATFGVAADTAFEPDEAFTVTATLDGIVRQADATIRNDDSGGVTVSSVDLSTYVRVGRYDLPEPTRTTASAGNLLAQEVSGVTYNWDTDTLFVVGDGGRAVTQVSKTGALIDTMTLAAGASPQGTEFYDPEGITYIGNGQFVMTEERDRQLVKFTYVADTTLDRASAQTVKLGTFVDNTGFEGLSYDPQTGGFVVVKEITPQGIFQTGVDFAAGTATNGSPTTVNSTDLFDPALAGLLDFADVFALSNLPSLAALADSDNLLVLSQESGRIVNIDRSGVISSSLQISADPGSPLSVAAQQHEGLTMDRDGFLYVVSENGGGSIDFPQLWVYAPSQVPNQAPTGVVLNNALASIVENTATLAPVKVADIVVADDGLGNNALTLSGADAGFFEITGSSLFLKAGTVLDFETKTGYAVTVNADDATLGATPDASVGYNLAVTDVAVETPVLPTVFISEVHSTGSSNTAYGADWFEITNTGNTAVDISGWKMDDNSNGTGQVVLRGVTSIGAGQSVVFIEGIADGSTDATLIANFSTAWFGSATLPAGVLVGAYGGSGVGLSSGGDAVNVFDGAGNRVTAVSFGAATTGKSFDNDAALGTGALPLPVVSSLSTIGVHGAFQSLSATPEIGSPGSVGKLLITEVAPWSSGNSPVAADWFEVTNTSARTIDITGWKMDDSSQTFAGSVALNGITSIAPGESVIFLESADPAATVTSFKSTWFGTAVPAGLQVGSYSGGGVGLGTGGDQVNLYNSAGVLQANVSFGASDNAAPFQTFDNAAGLNNTAVAQLSASGVAGAFVATNDANEIGSPGRTQAAALTAIHDIQGSGLTSPLVGQVVTTRGVVTAIDTNGSRGYYIQDTQADANAATSEAIFVFTNSAPSAALIGHLVEVRGTVLEFVPNGAAPGSLSTTQIAITNVGGVVGSVLDLGVSATAVVATAIGGVGGLLPPTQDLVAGIGFFESLEAMLVTVVDPVAVGPRNSFGEIYTVVDSDADPANGLNATGLTSRGNLLLSPGEPVFGDTNTQGGDFNPERIQIDDDSGILAGFVSPSVDVGARLSSVTGIVNYDFGNYQVVATQAYTVAQASTLVKETTTLVGDADRLTVAAYNTENLDPGDGAARFATIASEVIDRLQAPDIIALQEIQDNNGAVGGTGSTVTAADATLAAIVNAIAAAGGPAYAFLDNPFIGANTNGGEPGGNIRVAFLYRTDRVDFVEGSLASVAADGTAITDPALANEQQTNPDNPFFGSRPPLAGSFVFNGQEVTVVNNHFSSKGGSAPLFGSDQPPLNSGEVQRAGQAQAVNSFVDTLLAADPDARVVVLGDLNEFPFEEPIQVLKGTATLTNYTQASATYTPGGTPVLADLLDTLPAEEQFDYVFEGNSQTLDHVLVTGALQAGAQFDIVRINADFAVQTSDHEPLVASLLIPEPTFTLQLLHFYAETGTLATQTAPIMGAMIDRFDDQYANTLVLAEGDTWIPGPWLVGGADPSLSAVPGIGATALGRPDVAILNAFGTDASALGNHEFDLGSPVVSGAINASGAWVGAQFPFITANLNFAADSSLRGLADATLGGSPTNAFAGKEASTIKGKIAPSAVVTMNGEKVGLVGATTYDLLTKTSPNGAVPKDDGDPSTDDLREVAAYIQAAVDGLRAQGVDKIVMLDQLDTIARNKMLAPMLSGVDVMVAGGGHERIGDANDVAVGFNGHDADFVDNYPILATDLDGGATLIVTTDTEFTYLGRLVVTFNGDGELVLSELDPLVNGAYASDEATLQAVYGSALSSEQIIDSSAIGSKVEAIADAIDLVVTAKDGNKFGFSNVYLEGDRVFARAQETNLGNVTADANADKARDALPDQPFLVSLKNGGGIRSSIGSIAEDGAKVANAVAPGAAGNVSQLDVENALRFDNKLMVFDTTAQGLLNILNYAAGLSAGNGGFPQVGGVKFSFDPDNAAGTRVVNVALIDADGGLIAKIVENGVVLPGAPAVISVVALNFTANGGDGYPIKANGENFRYLLDDGTLSAPVSEALDFTSATNVPANAIGEQKAFEDYLKENFGTPEQAYDQADTPAALDLRIENLNLRGDAVFANLAPEIAGDLAVTVVEGGSVAITTADLDEADPDNSGFVLNYAVTATVNGTVLRNGSHVMQFSQLDLAAGLISFAHDGSEGPDAGFTVTLRDAGGLVSGAATVLATVVPVNDLPTITSPDNFTIAENLTTVGTVVASDPEAQSLTYALTGGDDQLLFQIDSATGMLSLRNPADFETREDADRDNVYQIVVSATDAAGEADSQAIGVAIIDVAESGIVVVGGGKGDGALVGSTGDDTISGGNRDDRIEAGDGDDIALGGNGNDTMLGGRGNDVLDGGNGRDTVDGGAGDNHLQGGNDHDVLRAADGDNTIEGGNGKDRLTVGDGNNVLFGGNGDDVLSVGAGDNLLSGGNGKDTFVFGAVFGKNMIVDFGGGDEIEFNGVFESFAQVQAASQQVGADTVISVDAAHSITLLGTSLAHLHASDFAFS